MFRLVSPFRALPIDENKAPTASLTGITPPEDIEMDIRNAMADISDPKSTISLNLFFFSSISETSGSSRSDFIPLYPFLN